MGENMSCSDVISKEEQELLKLAAVNVSDFVTSDQDTYNPYDGGSPKLTTEGIAKEADSRVAEAVRKAGYMPQGDWAAGVEYTDYNQVYYFNKVAYKALAIPYTAQGNDPTVAPDLTNVSPVDSGIGELESIALSLNVSFTSVIYADNTADAIPAYIRNDIDKTTYSVPGGAQGKFIQSVSGSTLTTTDGEIHIMPVAMQTVLNSDTEFAGVPSNFSGWRPLEPDYITEMKEATDVSVDSDGMTVKNKSIKAWNNARGIEDGACAASFTLGSKNQAGVEVEPRTEVGARTGIDDIGAYAGRDAVALFAQVNAQPATTRTANTVYTANSVSSPDFVDVWEDIRVGMIVDAGFATSTWAGAVIVSKTAPSTLNIQSWRKIDTTSVLAPTPANGTVAYVNIYNNIWAANFNALVLSSGDANQGIGIETGLILEKAGSNANSKVYYAVNLGGEAPEYCFTMKNSFQKGYTAQDCSVYGFQSTNDTYGLKTFNSGVDSFYSKNPAVNHIECVGVNDEPQFTVRSNGQVSVGTAPTSGVAGINVRGTGSFTSDYDKTEFQIYDPTTTLESKQGFYIQQTFPASIAAGQFSLGVGNTGSHVYNFAIQTSGVDRMLFDNSGDIIAGSDNTQNFGSASKRWAEIFAGNNVINTSDETLKTFGVDFSDAEKRVAVKLKELLTNYKWNESIEREKEGGNKARIHIGLGAQSLAQAFKTEGLNPDDYAMFCYDEWEESTERVQVNKGETEKKEVVTFIPVTEQKEVTEVVESFEMIDGKYTLIKTTEIVTKEIPVYDTHIVHDENGDVVIDKTTQKPKIQSVAVTKEQRELVDVPVDAVYEDVVIPAGNRYGIRLTQVLAFILANT